MSLYIKCLRQFKQMFQITIDTNKHSEYTKNMRGRKSEMKKVLKTVLIIFIIYGVILLYLLMVSNRFEKLEHKNYYSKESVEIKSDD